MRTAIGAVVGAVLALGLALPAAAAMMRADLGDAARVPIVEVRDGWDGHHRGGDWDRHGRGHGDWNRHRDWDRHRHGHGGSNFSLFFDLTPRPYYAPPAYYAPSPNCRPIVQSGWWYGRPAEIASTICYDPWGNSYVVDGSARVVRFLDGRPW